MSTLNRIVSATAFAVLWTAFMMWRSYPNMAMAEVILLSVIGTLLGVAWYFLFAPLWNFFFSRFVRSKA